MAVTPTKATYGDLDKAYDFFNKKLFGGQLPRCLITMQRKGRTYGYFHGQRFATRDGQEITDEIALNPTHFKKRTTEQSLSTLVHEMVHLRQHHFGKPPRGCYHNREWAQMMHEAGLIPSDTGEPGGKQTGQRVSHYIEPGGAFERACAELVGTGFTIRYVERGESEEERRRKAASKTRYTCPTCGANAWGKPELHIVCGDCGERMEAEDEPTAAGPTTKAGAEPSPPPAAPPSLEPPTIEGTAEVVEPAKVIEQRRGRRSRRRQHDYGNSARLG